MADLDLGKIPRRREKKKGREREEIIYILTRERYLRIEFDWINERRKK